MLDDVFASIRKVMVPIHPEGRIFIAAFAIATFILFLIWQPLGWIGVGLTVWCALSLRAPQRITPLREGIVVAPADGRVWMVVQAVPPAQPHGQASHPGAERVPEGEPRRDGPHQTVYCPPPDPARPPPRPRGGGLPLPPLPRAP